MDRKWLTLCFHVYVRAEMDRLRLLGFERFRPDDGWSVGDCRCYEQHSEDEPVPISVVKLGQTMILRGWGVRAKGNCVLEPHCQHGSACRSLELVIVATYI